MNKERLLQIANDLRHEDKLINHLGFNMATYGDTYETDDDITYAIMNRKGLEVEPECGTVGCIAGWATARSWGFKKYQDFIGDAGDFIEIFEEGKNYLGLTTLQAHNLFVSHTSSDITATKAATVIENLVLTGKVDWSIEESATPLIAAGLKRVS